jgi:phytoene desaturase
MGKSVAIVGAGVGGLAVAARLARRGFDVDVFEKLPECGGRNHMLVDRGFKFDMGPSFVLMPDFFEEVFQDCGRRLPDYLDLKKLDESYRIFFADGDRLSVFCDSEKTKAELERLERGAQAAYGHFIKETQRLYKVTRPLLMKCFTLTAMANPAYWPLLFKLRIFETYWGLARKYFKSEKLCFLFTFEAMFMGVSPFEAPAFYSIITYADHVQKIFHPMGGMAQIPLALERLGRELGVRYHYGQEVTHI